MSKLAPFIIARKQSRSGHEFHLIRLLWAACFFFTSQLATNSAAAQEDELPDVLSGRVRIFLGGFFPSVDSKIRLNSRFSLPTNELDFEDQFGLEDSKSVWMGGIIWKISEHHVLEFEYVELNRSGSVGAVTREFGLGDSVVQVGAQVDSSFDVALGRLTYGYRFSPRKNINFALRAGFHWTDAEAVMRLSGAVLDAETMEPIDGDSVSVESGDVSLPLPHFGASFVYAFNDRWAGRVRLMGFALEINDLDGSILDLGADLMYMPWKQFGVGAGFRFFRVSVEDVSVSDLNGKFEFDYFGPNIYAFYNF